MKRELALAELERRADAMRARGGAAAYLFGSMVRGDARPDSDLDVFLDIAAGHKFSLLDLVGVRRYLEAELGVSVEVTTRNSLHPKLRRTIEQEAVRAF